jgi:hypothetical protein
MSEDPRPLRKAPASPRSRGKRAQPDQAGANSSRDTFSSIPHMPTILSPEELAAGRTPRSPRDSYPPSQRLLGDNIPRRTREQSAARPLSQVPGTLKLPSIPKTTQTDPKTRKTTQTDPKTRSSRYPQDHPGSWRDWDDWDEREFDHYPASNIRVELQPGSELIPLPSYPNVAVSTDSVPDLAAFRPALAAQPPRRRVNTQMLIERARSPWSITRTILAVLMMLVALFATIGGMGEPSQSLMETAFAAKAGSVSAPSVAGRVQPETQLLCPTCYDNGAQFQAWGNAACSAAAASEVLTAWGVRGASIGKLIDTMTPDISLDGGLLRTSGFQRGVTPFGYQADISDHLTYNQMVYITHTLGLPVIVNVRISYGYFHFFAGGHFLVMTDGDSQGLRIVDSSEYYITYLPRNVFYSMFTGITIVIVPKGFFFSIPSS